MNGSTTHVATLVVSDRAMNVALVLEVIRTNFFLLSVLAHQYNAVQCGWIWLVP